MLHFALGKEYEDLGEYARGFDHVAAGCELQRRSINYDSAATIAEIDRIIRTQTRAWLASCRAGFAEADPIFVVGLPRTGTTLVERIIASHSAMISVGETGAFSVQLRHAMKANSGKPDFADISRRYIDSAAEFGPPRNPSVRRQDTSCELSPLRNDSRRAAESEDHIDPTSPAGYVLGHLQGPFPWHVLVFI